MKKITCFLILLLTFNGVLYAEIKVEYTDLIEVKKHSGYWQSGEYYYNKRLRENELRDIFNYMNNGSSLNHVGKLK